METSQTVTITSQAVTEISETVTQMSQNVTQMSQTVTQMSQTVTQMSQTVTQMCQNVVKMSQNGTQMSQNVTEASRNVTGMSLTRCNLNSWSPKYPTRYTCHTGGLFSLHHWMVSPNIASSHVAVATNTPPVGIKFHILMDQTVA